MIRDDLDSPCVPQEGVGAPSDVKKIKVFVRKGDLDGERRISFLWQGRIPGADLLKLGYALDGNVAVESVVGSVEVAMPTALRNAELRVIAVLGEYGYMAEFT